MPASLFLVLAILAPAQAQDVAVTLRVANAAFEYRDFEKVIALLDPLMHPAVMIAGAEEQLTARRLLGISRFVTGDLDAAQEELSQLLLLDPTHELDPTKVPPPVIETFVRLRDKMKPVLDVQILERQGRPRKIVPERAEMFLPLGGPQFKLQQWEVGYALGGLQVAGLAMNVAGWAVAASLDSNDDFRDKGLTAMYGGLATWTTAYLLSVLLGNVMLPN